MVVTTHSPDLLDSHDITEDMLRPVIFDGGETQIGELDEAGRTVLSQKLYTPGELLRMAQLRPQVPRASEATARLLPFSEQAGMTG